MAKTPGSQCRKIQEHLRPSRLKRSGIHRSCSPEQPGRLFTGIGQRHTVLRSIERRSDAAHLLVHLI